MNPVIERIFTMWRELPLPRKIAFGLVAMVIVAGFTTMFIWANRPKFSVAYSGLTKEDAAAIVTKLKENNTSYNLTGDGTTIMVPDSMVYDVRLTMAQEGIPKGGSVGFEIFDKTEFGTTEFVQNINKKRAIQGELARTIMAFEEVKTARVMIVFPKDSVFVEEIKKPSASILLKLNSDLEKEKVTSIAHLVASAVQDLTPKLVTIVDTAGRILFEGKSEEEKARMEAQNLANAQYQYKVRFEENTARRIQTMLERIVGKDKAIVRVTAEMDFSKNDMNEEIYDPFERGGEFTRSRKNRAEKMTRKFDDTPIPSTVNPIVPEGELAGQQGDELVDKSDDTFNYEISRRYRETQKPMAVLKRLSVAAVVDGNYEYKSDESGNRQRTFVPRSAEEMKQFHDSIVTAMGYSEDRNDQVSAECFPFASITELDGKPIVPGWRVVQKEYGRTIANLLLVLLLFLFIIRPIVKTVREIKTTVEQDALPSPEEMALLEEERDVPFVDMDGKQQKDFLDMMTEEQRNEFLNKMSPTEKAAYLERMSDLEKVKHYAEQDFIKTVNIIRGWVSEIEE